MKDLLKKLSEREVVKKKKKIIVDGKEYNLDEFDDTRKWSK